MQRRSVRLPLPGGYRSGSTWGTASLHNAAGWDGCLLLAAELRAAGESAMARLLEVSVSEVSGGPVCQRTRRPRGTAVLLRGRTPLPPENGTRGDP
jgi:hypothetical protein